jgi:hypothetical protein
MGKEEDQNERVVIQNRDIRLFKLVCEQKFLTRPQVIEHVFKNHKSAAKARLQKLVRLGYLKPVRRLVGEPASYLLGEKAKQALKASGYAFGGSREEEKRYPYALPEPQEHIELVTYEHDRKVTEARLVSEKLGLIPNWQSEKCLKMGWKRDLHVPDGYIRFGPIGVALEIELTLKSRKRYHTIFNEHFYTRKTQYALYLCDPKIFQKILRIAREFREQDKPLCFADYDQFVKDPLRTAFVTQRKERFRMGLLLRLARDPGLIQVKEAMGFFNQMHS